MKHFKLISSVDSVFYFVANSSLRALLDFSESQLSPKD